MKAEHTYYVYIMSSERNGTLYVGVTDNLIRRVYEHKNGLIPGFTSTRHVHSLVYYEPTSDIASAIQREKLMKHWPRAWKVSLIEGKNPEWKDLWEEITRM